MFLSEIGVSLGVSPPLALLLPSPLSSYRTYPPLPGPTLGCFTCLLAATFLLRFRAARLAVICLLLQWFTARCGELSFVPILVPVDNVGDVCLGGGFYSGDREALPSSFPRWFV